MGASDVGRENEGPSESERVAYVVRDREGRVLSEVRHEPLRTTTYYYYDVDDSAVGLGWSGELPFRSAELDVTRVVLTDEEGSPIVECRPVREEVAHQIILRDDSLGQAVALIEQ